MELIFRYPPQSLQVSHLCFERVLRPVEPKPPIGSAVDAQRTSLCPPKTSSALRGRPRDPPPRRSRRQLAFGFTYDLGTGCRSHTLLSLGRGLHSLRRLNLCFQHEWRTKTLANI
jgi:hypothetical protein